MSRVLIIEDNRDLATGLRNNLEIEGYDVEVAPDGDAGLEAARHRPFDLVILDLMLPGLHGFRVLKAIRQAGDQIPILILTALGEEADKVRGLRMGADDFVTKPFGLLELLARVETILRRARGLTAGEILRYGDIEIDPRTRVVKRSGKAVTLSPKEYELLLALARAGGAVVSRLELLRRVWDYSEDVVTRTVDTHIAELRRKLEPTPGEPRHILTVRKSGYRLAR